MTTLITAAKETMHFTCQSHFSKHLSLGSLRNILCHKGTCGEPKEFE